ncbi:23686_t:CDS:2 [Gigaspora rosea]|nr:23686_t:CDS:2 [Gigaspora rosea]
MSEEIHELTPAKRIKKPSYALLAEWVKRAWEALDPNLIRRSFKCCGISVASDGSEDEWIFDYDRLLEKTVYEEDLFGYENDWNEGSSNRESEITVVESENSDLE